MFDSGILDVVIGVVVVYLQISLVCTAVNELVALWLKKRAKELEKGIRGLLTKPELVDKFYDHPLVKALQPDGRKPSYIPARTFSLALMDIIRRHSFDGTVKAAAQAVADNTAARDAAQTAMTAATANLTAAQGVNQAATTAQANAGVADNLQASKNVEEAANNQAAAQTASDAAATKFAAAQLALTEATTYQANVTAAAAVAQGAETAAQTAETAAKADPKNATLAATAKAARETANTAADALAPSASSLLTEARDKVAGVQDDVVPPELKTALLALMDNAGTNLNKAQANVEQWFDDAMDRVSGVYKRKSHVFVVCIAVLVTVLANVDTLQLADALSHDKALRETLVAAAPELAKADKDLVDKQRGINPDGSSTSSTPTPTPTPPGGGNSNPIKPSPGATPAATPAATPTAKELPTPSLSTIKASLDVLKEFGLPIGYVRVCTPNEEKVVDSCVTTTEADARVNDTKAKLKKAEDDLEKADGDLPKAQTDLEAAQKALKIAEDTYLKDSDLSKKATADNKSAAEVELAKAQTDRDKKQKDRDKAQTDLDKAKTARDKSADDLTKAQAAQDKAKAKAAELQQLESQLTVAEDDAKKHPEDGSKQQLARDLQRQVAFAAECPKCRKESDLSPAELRRRLPTTHDYNIRSFEEFRPAVGALERDILELLYTHWLGWALTAFAVSLGAPFWFDMLNKLIVVRSTVKPHEKSKEQESKDNPDEKDGSGKT